LVHISEVQINGFEVAGLSDPAPMSDPDRALLIALGRASRGAVSTQLENRKSQIN
jgi:hypothetical protein